MKLLVSFERNKPQSQLNLEASEEEKRVIEVAREIRVGFGFQGNGYGETRNTTSVFEKKEKLKREKVREAWGREELTEKKRGCRMVSW